MNKFFTTLLTLATLALAVPAMAGGCSMTTSTPELALPTGHYVDNDLCQPDCTISLWVYQESNGIDGLQRGDETVDDVCGGDLGIDADTIVF